ncbi:MAG: hypothetical protein ACI9ZH_002446, partial [Paracoccaceae bacterium]
ALAGRAANPRRRLRRGICIFTPQVFSGDGLATRDSALLRRGADPAA